jgi:hypothetical protein
VETLRDEAGKLPLVDEKIVTQVVRLPSSGRSSPRVPGGTVKSGSDFETPFIGVPLPIAAVDRGFAASKL